DPLEATPVCNDGVATSYIFGRKIGGRYMDGISGRLSRKLKVVKIADGRVWIPFASKTLLLTDDAIATLGVSPGDEVEVDIEDGFITEVHADSVVAKPTLLRDPLAGNAVRASIFGSKLGVKLNSLPLVIENARTFSVGRHWEVVTGRKFKIGRAGMNFRNRRISAYIGADGEVLYWKEADRLTELENAMIAAHAKFSSDRRGLVSNDVFVSREFRPMIQRLGWAVQSNNRADWAPGIAELLNSSELSVSQCIDALAFMQKQVYSAGWSMQKYRVVADEFERVLSMLGDDRREAIQFVLSQPMMQRFLQLFIS
ncbi:MAG: hypothetical protein HN337_03955, partial [Deltaproteobacteria bacterium]|nr:hypothetical protein [Deltaproteobacteria bacterium]